MKSGLFFVPGGNLPHCAAAPAASRIFLDVVTAEETGAIEAVLFQEPVSDRALDIACRLVKSPLELKINGVPSTFFCTSEFASRYVGRSFTMIPRGIRLFFFAHV